MKLAPVFFLLVAGGCGRQASVGSPALPPPAPAQTPVSIPVQATATINDISNTRIGSASFTDTRAGLLVSGTVTGLGIGDHGVHLHAIGTCQAPAFTSAGPHFNPGNRRHGFRNPAGHHAGDLPNIVSPPAGPHSFQFVVEGVKLTGNGGLLDGDGASIVIHSSGDDYVTDPSGNSGGRLACGVITPAR